MIISHLCTQEAEHMTTGQSDRMQGRLQTHATLVTSASWPRGYGDPGQQIRHHWVTLAISCQTRPLGILGLLISVRSIILDVEVCLDNCDKESGLLLSC